ncbi:MAG: hypothetical protein ACTSVV_14215 [Promethearchaeota archaeon]
MSEKKDKKIPSGYDLYLQNREWEKEFTNVIDKIGEKTREPIEEFESDQVIKNDFSQAFQDKKLTVEVSKITRRSPTYFEMLMNFAQQRAIRYSALAIA